MTIVRDPGPRGISRLKRHASQRLDTICVELQMLVTVAIEFCGQSKEQEKGKTPVLHAWT